MSTAKAAATTGGVRLRNLLFLGTRIPPVRQIASFAKEPVRMTTHRFALEHARISPPQQRAQRRIEQKRQAAELDVLERGQRREKRGSGQITGEQPPSPLAVDPERHENLDETKPCKGQEQQRSERDERAVEKTDVAKGYRTQHPAIAASPRPDRKSVRLRMKEKADDKMCQLVGDRAGKRE